MIVLSNRVRTYARLGQRAALIKFFTDILEAETVPVPGTSIVAFRFPDNSSHSVEFTEDALDEQQARRGAWLEVKSDDAESLKEKVRQAGLAQVEYVTGRFYFQVPGGQVWGILPIHKP